MLSVTAFIEIPATGWNSSRIEFLTEKWAQGFSATWIGDELGVTRNAVLGKIHRLGKSKARAVRVKPMRGPDKAPREKKAADMDRRLTQTIDKARRVPPTIIEEAEPPAEFLGLALMDLGDNNCRFPRGESPNITFCGQPIRAGSYCVACSRIAYYEPRPSRVPFMFRSW
jgi:GcrA cell cycle regulator